jgi:hypothetical protein
VNPAHLFLGTQQDNVRDMIAKGRGVYRARGSRPRLKADQVAEIRAADVSERGAKAALARAYGVTPQAIRLIRSGERHKT